MKHWEEVEGWFHPMEARKLQELAKDKVCVEVGSYKGKSTCALLEVTKHVHAVDYFRSHVNGQCQEETYTTLEEFKENTAGGPVTIWIGSSLHACRNFETDSIDLVFIDGLHTYEAVMSDIIAWWEKLKIGGIFCFHDYSQAGVRRAIHNIFDKVDGRAGDLAFVTKQFQEWERKEVK